MNARARILVQSEISLENFIYWFCRREMLLMVALITALFLSAISVVYVKDQYRQLTHTLQSLQSQQTRLEVQREQLLLEESTWTSQSRVHHIASNQLGMAVPGQVFHLQSR